MVSKLKKQQLGQARAQAKGAGRNMALQFATDIVQALEGADQSLGAAIKAVVEQPAQVVAKVLDEVTILRDERVSYWQAEQQAHDKDSPNARAARRQISSVRSSFQRPITVLQALAKGLNRDLIGQSTSITQMYGYAKLALNRSVKGRTWSAQTVIQRVIKGAGKDETKQIARIEAVFAQALAFLAKHEHTTHVPVMEIIKLGNKKVRPILRKAA